MANSILNSLAFWRSPAPPRSTHTTTKPGLITQLSQTITRPARTSTSAGGHAPASPRPKALRTPSVSQKPSQIDTARGRQPQRRTSKNRVNQRRRGKKVAKRKPLPSPKKLTPTTETAMEKEKSHARYSRQHGRYEKKRVKEGEIARLLSRDSTYWRELRSGTRYRSFGGTRPRKFEAPSLKYQMSKVHFGRK